MLREDQIDLRRQRARSTQFLIENLGKNRVFSDYSVSNPESGGRYAVVIRGFEIGDNHCTCPDFKANTLGTCKHIEAVLEHLRDELPPQFHKKKAAITRPRIDLHYGEQVQLALTLPPRRSDQLTLLARRFFDDQGRWSGHGKYQELIDAIEEVPEEVTVSSDALDLIDREVERAEMMIREQELLQQLSDGTLSLQLLKQPLYEYQLRGAIFLACRGRAILGDDMGLGKTIQTLAAVELLAQERGVRRVLVVAPASVKYQWAAEIRKYTDRDVQIIEGDPEERLEQYSHSAFYFLVNYEQVIRDREAINQGKPDVVVLDEAQRIKNWESKTSKEVKKLTSRYAIVLTGTPIENRLEELYSIVQFVDERRFGPAFQFLHDHRVLNDEGQLIGYRNLERIREKLAPILLRRTRQEVLTQLPARTDSIRWVELADGQRQPYEEQRTVLARLLQKPFLSDLDRKRVLACLTSLRLICDSTYLYDPETRVSPKLDEFAETIPELLEGHKVVVFSQWETMIRLAAEVLTHAGIEHVVLHGGLSGVERKAVLDRFTQEESCQVFLSTDAGSTGLNLQVADTVMNLELPWNPAVLEQRIARVHRLGQSNPVRVIHLVTRGTIEERVLETVKRKQSLFDGLFAGDEDSLDFRAVNQKNFIEGLRELLAPRPPEQDRQEPHPVSAPNHASEPNVAERFCAASVTLLETLPELVLQHGKLPGELVERMKKAAADLLTAAERIRPS